ncbi:hypothetical protein ElyMa_004638800 [Elysia marginata]|uniref:Cadherin domain-containing protein n=1 Tax=Elysia marginata TaxID=1093978 RepID=A0AAV4I084_9GAST|nr:hypothetical protein ElyMa_004638800 [Elysia marginata]
MKPYYKVVYKDGCGIAERPNRMERTAEGESGTRGRACNYATKPCPRRRYALISRANALGGWAQETMKKRWMQKWWRRRKKKRLRHSKPPELRPETSSSGSSRGFDLIRGQNRAEERVSLLLSQALLRVISRTRTLGQAIPRVTPVTRTGIKFTVPSDHLSSHSARSDADHPSTDSTIDAEGSHFPNRVTTVASCQGLAESTEYHPPTLFRSGIEHDRSDSSKATSNPFQRLTESRSHNHTHTIFTACVSYPICCCDKNEALNAKHSCPNVFSLIRPSLPKPYGNIYRYAEGLNTSPQTKLEYPAEGNKSTPLRCTSQEHLIKYITRTRKQKRQKVGGDCCSQTAKLPATTFKPRKFSAIGQSVKPISQIPSKESHATQHHRTLSWWWTYLFLALLCNTSGPSICRVFCQVGAAKTLSSFAPRPSYLTSRSSSSSSSSSSHSPSQSARSSSPVWPARYRLIPPSRTNETIFIYFSPPFINNLRVNTRQKVSFNFTVQRQGPAIVSSPSASFQDTTSTLSESAVGAKGAGKGHVDTAVNDAASDADQQQPSSTAATASVTNESNSNSNSHVSGSETTKTSSSNSKFHLNEDQGKKAPVPASPSNRLKTGVHREQQYRVMIYSDNDIIARPLVSSRGGQLASVRQDARGSYILMDVTAGRTHNFSVEARHIGRVTVSVAVVDVALDKTMHLVRTSC